LYDLKFIEIPVDNILNQQVMNHPINMETSVYHKQRYEQTVDNTQISYEKYCHLEKNIADIVDNYASDKKHHWCIFLNKNFLYADSIQRFLSKSVNKNILWISDSITVGFPDMVLLKPDIHQI
jgi:hypothetical protein